MVVIVTGGREFTFQHEVSAFLDAIHREYGITMLIHGGARGADSCAHRWAYNNDVAVVSCPADWERYGKAAGPIRNREMLEMGAELVVAFPGGRGTSNMVGMARAAGVEVREFVGGQLNLL